MFRSVLIANRGEIARRVIRTAKWMGVRTVAVHSEADSDALHVLEADESHRIGDYLDIAAIIAAAKESEADSVHPGYGFLAENAEFAEACADAGIAFIGPSPDAIRAMGDKAAAKAIMEKAGVPVVPGYHGKDQKESRLLAESEKTGWPVLLKASAGGGGKGMRIVRGKAEFADALASARRESKASFGDDRMLVERYIERPRHIEVQVFGDGNGNIVHLFERDCSIQRRHQKVIEEAPAPGVDEIWRARVCEAAVNAAKAVDYLGAGTVEFIVEAGAKGAPGDFWFMEMNTRLQVEHPVTEAITGTDLVEWQFRVAAGEALPLAQDEIAISGHAIEARIYAEDPANGFLPSPGRIGYAALPRDEPGIRVEDGGVGPGVSIPPDYDPMIAKIIGSGRDREGAIGTLRGGLGQTRIAGIATNVSFLSRVLDHAEFRSGAIDTGFIERHADVLLPPPADAPPDVLALASLALLEQRRRDSLAAAKRSGDPWSPWARAEGWRLNDTGQTVLRFIDNGREVDIPCGFAADGYRLDLPGGSVLASLDALDDEEHDELSVLLDGEPVEATIVRDGDALHVFRDGEQWRLELYDPLAAAESHEGAGGRLTAPMPGKVAAVLIEAGEAVTAGQALIVVEAMKMEHSIHAPADGTVTEVRFKAGDQVSEGEILLGFEETD